MRKLLILSVVICLFLSCNNETDLPGPSSGPFMPEAPTGAAVYSYLALGDSYTIGEDVAEEDRYPVQLSRVIDTEEIDLLTPDIVARTGWTTAQLQQGIASTELEDSYDLVSLLIGVNNQFRNRSIEEYETEFQELLDQAIGFADGNKDRVFVLSIPDYAFTPFGQASNDPTGISAGIDAFNAVNRALTSAADIAYFDITPISREGLNNPDLVASDGLHPSGLQYQAWVEQIEEAVRLLLEN